MIFNECPTVEEPFDVGIKKKNVLSITSSGEIGFWEHDIEASKMQGRARGRKGERKTYHITISPWNLEDIHWMWQKTPRAQERARAKRKGSYPTKKATGIFDNPHLVLFKVILPFLDYGLAGKSCSYSSQSQLRRRATIGLVLIVLSIWDSQILYMLQTCFRATATVSSLLWGEWLRVWLWSLNSQLNLALLQEWARSEWSIWTLKTVCLMLRKHVGIRDFLSTVETGFRDHRNPGAAILWVEASFVYDGWMSGIEQLCAIDTPQGGSGAAA